MSIDSIKYLSNVDAQLARVIKAVGQYSIKVRNNAFQSLVESIIKYYNEAVPTSIQILSSPDTELKSKVGLSSKK